MRIFIGTTEIAGIGNGLHCGLKEIGVNSTVVFSRTHRFGYGDEGGNALTALWRKLEYRPKNLVGKILVGLFAKCTSILVLAWAAISFDVFVFLYGENITNTIFELWLLKKLKKKVILWYVGSDTRPPFIDGPTFPEGKLKNPQDAMSMAYLIKNRTKHKEHYADFVICNPFSAQFLEREFINWFAMGFPRALSSDEKCNALENKMEKVRILHSPSHSVIKGTTKICEVIDRLKEKGHSIDFVTIENMPNFKILEELRNCDFVVDQLYSDTPLAGFAVEAAHFGKPAVVAGYAATVMPEHLKNLPLPPSLFVHPDKIEEAIEKLVIDARYRNDLGQKAKSFVESYWSVRSIAIRFMQLIDGVTPSDWWFSPKDIRYTQGCGMSEKNARNLVKGLIDQYGKEALQLSDKFDLEHAFVEFAAHDVDTLQ